MFEEALALEAPTIIVDNTNIRPKEFSEYVADAHERGYKTMVVGIQCRSDADAEMFFRRCVHGVPLNGIMKMKADYTEEGSDVMIPPWGVRTHRSSCCCFLQTMRTTPCACFYLLFGRCAVGKLTL